MIYKDDRLLGLHHQHQGRLDSNTALEYTSPEAQIRAADLQCPAWSSVKSVQHDVQCALKGQPNKRPDRTAINNESNTVEVVPEDQPWHQCSLQLRLDHLF